MAQTQKAEAPNFGSILDRPAAAAVRPPPFPIGDYICVVKGLPRKDKSTNKGTDFIEYTLQPLQAIEGTVDEDALEAFGGLAEKTMKLTFYITEKSEYRHKEFLYDDLKLDIPDDPEEGESHWEGAQRTPGHQCIVHVKHTPSGDGKGVYSEISGTAAVE